MRSRQLAALLVLAVSRPAAADSHKLLVLQSEGRADAATRARIDAAIVKLAQGAEPQTSTGELNYSDAATAVGCKPETAACKDEVLGMLAVDEIVITTVTPKPGGTEVVVRRVQKGGATRDATMLLPTGAPPDKLDGIAPLFGGKPVPAAAPAPPTASAVPAGPALTTTGRPRERSTGRSPERPTDRPTGEPPVIPAPAAVKQPPPSVAMTTTSAHADASPSPQRQRLEIAGMAGGGGLVVLGVLLWGAASGIQSDIDKAPTTTKQNLIDLKDLESRGDGYAGLGNLFVIGGLVVGGLGTYFYIKDRRTASTTSARLTPTVLDHGAGVVLRIGGLP